MFVLSAKETSRTGTLLSLQNNDKERDVIAATASAHGQGAIAVVRLSGAEVLRVVEKIFSAASFSIRKIKSHRMYYGEIHRRGEIIDEVMLCYMKSPRSFTCEDSVEIFCHGGMFVVSEILATVLENGARLAEPGEFTKRAFLNGRINLSQAEAVMDLINSKNGAARRAALRQLGGGLSARVERVRDKILTWLAHIELSIDYPEHEDESRNASEILFESGALLSDLKKLNETANIGRVIREGVRTAIIGRPNVGKSTLLNAILHENRAIVHETAGTTRDVLTEEVRVGDVPLVIMDTAGLRETADPIEKIGIEKTREAAIDAELILYVADSTDGLTDDDAAIIKNFSHAKIIILMNKSDLRRRAGRAPDFEGLSQQGNRHHERDERVNESSTECAPDFEGMSQQDNRRHERDERVNESSAECASYFEGLSQQNNQHQERDERANESSAECAPDFERVSQQNNQHQERNERVNESSAKCAPDFEGMSQQDNRRHERNERVLLTGEPHSVLPNCGEHPFIALSAKTGDGLDLLFAKIRESFLSGIGAGGETDIITRERHKVLLSQTIFYVEKAMLELREGVPEDLVSVSLRAAYIALGEILGAEIGDDIVDRIFAEFCVGK
jgi:tRNA modification GTPase